MPANWKEIYATLDAEHKRKFWRYPDNSAGSMMTTEYVNLTTGMTVADAISHIRRTGVDKETIYTCYVTQNKLLVGSCSVKDLLVAKDEERIEDIMETNVISVHTLSDQEEVAQMLSKYNFITR